MELRSKGVDAQAAADLDKIAFESKRVAQLIDSMKRLTLRDEETAKRIRLDIGEALRQTVRLYAPILERSGVTLEVYIADNLPPVLASPEEVTQVLFNLLQNAKRHTACGTITVSSERDGDGIWVCVADTGEGIAPELLANIFERGVSARQGGTGIGLAVCKEIVTSHGGAIGIQSHINKGTAVTFTLPVCREDDQHGT